MRRFLFCLLCLGSPVSAWEFRADGICTLSHQERSGSVLVTFDPAVSQYAISLRRANGQWPSSTIFAMRFNGPRGLTITTDRHFLSEDGVVLTVRDRGFGNVLDGLEFNETAFATTGESEMKISLEGAADHVASFRACVTAPIV